MPTKSDKTPDAEMDFSAENQEPVENAEESTEAATDQAKEYYDRLLRVSAEFENYKKRNDREMVEFRKYANESVLKALLPVIDNFERALSAAEEGSSDCAQFLEGVKLIHADFLKILEQFQVTPIDALGKPFDPQYHQAMMRQESVDVAPNTVLTEIQKGYMFHDRLLRPSAVVVSTEPAS